MSVPADILAVERPTNTIVRAYGKNKDHYMVIARKGCKRVGNRNEPIDGGVVGHIINYKFVPCEPDQINKIKFANIDIKDWANIRLCLDLSADILEELQEVYDYSDAIKIYCIAILRVCNHGIKDYELKEAYDTSFLSEVYPGVGMSRNTVGEHLENIGKTYSRIVKFMRSRVAEVGVDDITMIDSTKKTDHSRIDSFSELSHKAKVPGQKTLGVMFMYNYTKRELVCSKCYPGNMLDVTAYCDFVRENCIDHGVIVADKGFPMSSIAEVLEEHPTLSYLNPVKRNSRLITTHKMTEYTDVLAGHPGVTYKKAKVNGENKWLYAFRDEDAAHIEEKTWLAQRNKEKPYSEDELRKARLKFGTIVMESNLDSEPKEIYRIYKTRWQIELIMRYYKSALELDDTREHNDYTVIGSEFCDFIAAAITKRLEDKFDDLALLDKHTVKEILHVLKYAKKVRTVENGEWLLRKINPGQLETLYTLELLDRPKQVKRKVGRPKKN